MWTWSEDPYDVTLRVILIFGAILGLFYFMVPKMSKEERLRRRRGKAMQDAREAYLWACLADIITEGVDEYFLDNKISGNERKKLFKLVNRRLRIRDLCPRNSHLSQTILKKEIERRLESNQLYYDRNENRRKVIFPDTPGWKVRFQHSGGVNG